MRLINADVPYKDIFHQERLLEKCYVDHLGIITEQPTVDAVPVVRCKDCKWWKNNDCKNDMHGYIPLDENDFCSRGERKGGDE